jgi:hypothetical protein
MLHHIYWRSQMCITCSIWRFFISMDQNFAHRVVPVSSLLPVIVSYPVWNSKYKECLLWLFIIECTQEHFLRSLWCLRFRHHLMAALLLLRQTPTRSQKEVWLSGYRAAVTLMSRSSHLGHNALLLVLLLTVLNESQWSYYNSHYKVVLLF